MKATNRRDFLKACACTAGLCGFGSFLDLMANDKVSPNDDDNAAKSEAEKNEAFALHWITELLESLDGNELTDAQLRAIVKKTSQAHHDLMNVPEMVKPYIGKPEEFIEFLQNAWGWEVKDNPSERLLTVNEKKPFCVCPLLKNASGKRYPALCYCSEGFAEKMFSIVYTHPVSVTVGASVQRGDPSCIYLIRY